MERDEILSKIGEVCLDIQMYDIEERCYDNGSKIELNGYIKLKGEPNFVMLFFSKKEVISSSYLDIRNNLRNKINEFLGITSRAYSIY